MIRGSDLLGDGVNIAARLEGLAEPGGVCVSGDVYRHVRKALPLNFTDMGPQVVKNIEEPVQSYTVRIDQPRPQPASTAPVAPKALPLPDKPSMAVLPFTNMSGDLEQEYFADGIVEDIITALSRVKWFFVIARNSSFVYKGKAVDVRQVGRELGGLYVLEGSIRRAGSRVRIRGQLIEAESRRHVWADKFDGDLADIFDLQDRLTESIVGAIEPSLRLAEMERARAKPTDSLDAYDLCLRAMYLRHRSTKEDTREALRHLDEAMRLDPRYALPKALAAYCYSYMIHEMWAEPDDRSRSMALARSALSYGQDDPNALWMAGKVLGYVGRDFDGALSAVDRALFINTNLAPAYGASGWVRIYVGELETAIEHLHRAFRLSPLDPESYLVFSGLGWALAQLGRPEEALGWATRCVQEHPAWSTGHRAQIIALIDLGRKEEAKAAGRRYMELYPDFRLSAYRAQIPMKDEHWKDHVIEVLSFAGLPE
jgi:adenylate cyclase